jgi:hypothetical protein
MTDSKTKPDAPEPEKAAVTLPATVEKIIPSIAPSKPDKAQISVHTAEDLYKEIRIDNDLKDADGNPVELKKGATVEVTVEATPDAVVPKNKK